jgi:hypothetical protein
MAQANQADLFGEGVNAGVRKPYDPNDEPNPNNPGGLSNNEMLRLQRRFQSNPANRQGNPSAGYGGSPQQIAAARAANQAAIKKPDSNTFLDAVSSLGRNPVINPIGYAATKAGKYVDRQLGTSVSGYIQDPAGQALADLGAPDAVQLLANPTGYATRTAVNAGTGYGTNPGQILQNASSAANNLRNDARNTQSAIAKAPRAIAGAVNSLGNLGGGGAPQQYQAPAYSPVTQSAQSGSALSSEAQRIIGQAGQFAQQNAQMSQQYGAQAAAAGGRAAPQITAPSSATAMGYAQQAGNFQPDTSGIAGIRAATADVSGAGRLEGFRSTNSEQGVNALYAYNPDATYNSANQLGNFYAENTAEGANRVASFNPDMVQADAESLRQFRADRTGIDRLNAYADEAQGPSAAQAMLRGQADADKRTMLAIARSGRGGPGAAVNAQRQAITEGGLIAAETRGQAAVLAAQETDQYKQRQLQALAQAGSLIGQAEAQRLTALSNAGALMSQADQQKLAALTAYGQLKATQDSQQLSARQSAGQLNLGADQARLGAISNAAQVQSAMDAQKLSAEQSAAQIRLSGSEINQRGAIAASAQQLEASAQKLQGLSIAGNISTAIRGQDIDVLKANLDSSLQTMGLNDQQVRFFSQMQQDRDLASQNMQMQASALGINATQAQEQLNLQWSQFAYNQLSGQQQQQYNYAVLNSNNANAAAANARANRQEIAGYAGAGLSALSKIFGSGGGSGGSSGSGAAYVSQPLQPVPSLQLSMPTPNFGYQPTQPRITY